MSQEKVLKTLESLGLAKLDAQIYILLGKRGPQKAMDIAKALKMRRQRLYDALKNLESKGLVNATLQHPAKFSALPFEKALDLFVKAKMEEARRIEGGKQELFSDWQSISVSEATDQSPKFSILEGRNSIYPRLKQMIEETRKELSIVSTFSGLLRADQSGLLEAAFNHAAKTNTKFRFITELPRENLKAVKQLVDRMPQGSDFEGRTPELGIKPMSRMLLRDNTEAAFFVSQDADGTTKDADEICLWTNSSAMVNSFKTVFEDMWQGSTEIRNRIAEIETGKQAAKTRIINDSEEAEKKYDDAIDAAHTEIVMLTSSAGLVEAWKNSEHLNALTGKGVSIKVMAPVIRDNLEAALQLSKFCLVRHIPMGYLGTTIIDNAQFFQFKNPLVHSGKPKSAVSFEGVFYTNDFEYVKKGRSMLDEIWKQTVTPSAVTVEDITKPPRPPTVPVLDNEYTVSRIDSAYQKSVIDTIEAPGAVTEEYILKKLINAKRVPVIDPTKDPIIYYGSDASAVIHPPSTFNLPDMFLTFYHYNKQSSYGGEDWFIVSLWLDTPKGKAFVPVAIAGDNPQGMEHRSVTFAGTPASKNLQILKTNELQIQLHGNTLFAAWTVPIPLFPAKYTLPPGSVLFEGYGRLKTVVLTSMLPSGTKVIQEGNGFDSFVTFFHPSSKYAGPGTDGILARDFIATVYPPPAPK